MDKFNKIMNRVIAVLLAVGLSLLSIQPLNIKADSKVYNLEIITNNGEYDGYAFQWNGNFSNDNVYTIYWIRSDTNTNLGVAISKSYFRPMKTSGISNIGTPSNNNNVGGYIVYFGEIDRNNNIVGYTGFDINFSGTIQELWSFTNDILENGLPADEIIPEEHLCNYKATLIEKDSSGNIKTESTVESSNYSELNEMLWKMSELMTAIGWVDLIGGVGGIAVGVGYVIGVETIRGMTSVNSSDVSEELAPNVLDNSQVCYDPNIKDWISIGSGVYNPVNIVPPNETTPHDIQYKTYYEPNTETPIAANPAIIESVDVYPNVVNLDINATQQIYVNVNSNNENYSISYVSNDSSIASVDNLGTIKGVSQGETYITVSVGNIEKRVSVSVGQTVLDPTENDPSNSWSIWDWIKNLFNKIGDIFNWLVNLFTLPEKEEITQSTNEIINETSNKFGDLFMPINWAVNLVGDLGNVQEVSYIEIPALFKEGTFRIDFGYFEESFGGLFNIVRLFLALFVSWSMIYSIKNTIVGGKE